MFIWEEFMKKYVWAKTLLSVYPYLEVVADDIDRQVDIIAKNSFYVTGVNFVTNSTSMVADNIIELSQRKVSLINIKVLIEKAFKECKSELAQILIQKYVDHDKSREIAESCNLSMRTYFRKLDEGLKAFAKSIAGQGFTDDKLKKYLQNEDWIMIVFSQLEETNEDIELSDKLIKRLALS